MEFQNKAEYRLLSIISSLFFILRKINTRLPSKLLSYLLIYIIPLRKKVIHRNLRIAFPELSPERIKYLVKEIYRSSAKTLAEVIFFHKFSEKDVRELVELRNFEVVKEKLTEEKGLILLTAHFGNWELGGLAIGLSLEDTKLNVLFKQQRNPYVTEWLNKMRSRFGNVPVPLGASVRNIYKVLGAKGVVGVVGDQRGPKEGLRVKFFGRETAVYPGTAVIALKLNIPIVFTLTIREKNDKYIMIFEEIDYEGIDGTLDEKVRQINQIYMNKLERYIKKYPEQWFWMHNIWKY